MSIDFSKELNVEQYAAVTEGDGPCLVLAGAGSGKTRVITYRVAYLLAQGVKPEEILLLTFTNKAAHEMLERVKKIIGQTPQGLWGGTFHNIGYRLVRTYAARLGYPSALTILDSEDAEHLLAQVLKEEGVDPKDRKWPSARVISEIFSFQRNAIIPLEEAIDIKHPRSTPLAADLARVQTIYTQRKLTSGFVDFDDLLTLWLRLLTEVPAVATALSRQFRYILVDEYQDTNRVQAAIIKKMSAAHGNVLVVGDDAQSIYSFRAADIANILNFTQQYKKARVFKLLTNYRSTPDILAVANQVIAQNTQQITKELRSTVAALEKPRLLTCETTLREAEKIIEEIIRLQRAGHRLADVAVLFRSTFHSQPIEMELTRRGIPYDYRGGLRFFERAHVKDVLAYLRAWQSTKDSLAWQRVLVQQEGIGLETARKLYEKIKAHPHGLAVLYGSNDLVVEKRAAAGWRALQKTWAALETAGATPGQMIRVILTNTYRDFLEREFINWRERVGDIEQLAGFAERAVNLKDFLAESALQEQYRGESLQKDKVVLSTVHQAKGLEWGTVFVVNLTANGFPNERAQTEEGGIEEERRLFYVAITRARHKLFLSYAVIGGRQNDTVCLPSPFLEEIDRALLQTTGRSINSEVVYEKEEPTSQDWRKKSFLRAVDQL